MSHYNKYRPRGSYRFVNDMLVYNSFPFFGYKIIQIWNIPEYIGTRQTKRYLMEIKVSIN